MSNRNRAKKPGRLQIEQRPLHVERGGDRSRSWWTAMWTAARHSVGRALDALAAWWRKGLEPDDASLDGKVDPPDEGNPVQSRQIRTAQVEVSLDQYVGLSSRVKESDKRIAELERRLDELAELVTQARSSRAPAGQGEPVALDWNAAGPAQSQGADEVYESRYDGRADSGTSSVRDVADELMDRLDETALTDQQALDWIAERGAKAEVVSQSGTGPYDWRLLRVSRGDSAVIVPNLRRPMGQTPLREYFEMSGYNGVDALKKHQVRALPQQRRSRGGWQTQPGRIHG